MLVVPKHFCIMGRNGGVQSSHYRSALYNHGRINERSVNSPRSLTRTFLRHSLKSHHKHLSYTLFPSGFRLFLCVCSFKYQDIVFCLIFCHNPQLWSNSPFFHAGPGHVIPLKEPIFCPLYSMHYV